MKINPALKEELKKHLENQVLKEKQTVTVISTYALSKDEIHSLISLFPGLREDSVINTIDKSIIGGIVLKFGSKIIDLSIKSSLHTFMQKHL